MKGRGRLRTAVRFLLRSLDLRVPHFLLALLSVAVGTSVAATALDLRADLRRKMSVELRSFGPNLIVLPRAGAVGSEGGGIGRQEMDRAGEILGEAPWVPLLYAAAATPEGGASVAGIPFDARARAVFSYWRIEGEWPAERLGSGMERDESPCLAGRQLARRLGARPGDPLEVTVTGRRLALRLSGVITTGEAEDEQLFIPIGLLAGAREGGPAASALAVRIPGGGDAVEAAARSVEAAAPGLEARPLRQVAAAEGRLLGRLDLMMTVVGGLVLILSALCVMTTLAAVVVQREPEIGVMRSLGAGDAEIVRMLLGEATLLGLAGGLLGFGLGALNARLVGRGLFGAAIAPRPEILPAILAVAVLLCWIAAIVPVRRAFSIQPASVLRGE